MSALTPQTLSLKQEDRKFVVLAGAHAEESDNTLSITLAEREALTPDETPNAFTFTDVTGVTASTQQTSNTITVAGLGVGVSVAVTITGGTYSKNGGSYTSSAGTAVNGDTFAVRHTSSASGSTAVDTTLTIGGVSDTFTSTTAAVLADAIIIIVAGQSNARKAATSPLAVPARYTSLSNTNMWIDASGAPAAYVAGTNSGHRGAEAEWGTEAERIHLIRESGDTRPIYVVKEAKNGNALASVDSGDWHPDNAGERFEGLENQVAALRAWLTANTAHTTFDEEVLWNQGEADANTLATANAYAANWTYFLSEFRSRISASAFFIAERIRPLGYEGASVVDNTAGFAQAYTVREAVLAGILADGNGTVIDTDFDTDNFTQIHPQEPDPWDINSWTTQIGLRAHAARVGTYTATYGDITDAVPDAFAVPAESGEEATVVSSGSVAIAGIERRAAVVLPAGVEMRILNGNGSLHTDWTTTPGFIDKFQTFAVRATAPAEGVTTAFEITIGGVSADWEVTGTAAVTYRADTQAWLDALAAAGGSSLNAAEAAAVNNFFQAGEDDGWMAKVQAMVLPLGSEIAATIDLKTPANIWTKGGTTTLPWNAGGYWLPDDNNQYLDSATSPSAATTQNAIGVGAWIKVLGNSTAFLVGSDDGSVGFRVRSSGSVRAKLNSTNMNFSGLTIDTVGFYMANRTGASASAMYGPAGTSLGSSTVGSITPTATDFRIGINGTTDKESGVGGVWLTEGMVAAEIQDMRDAMATLLAAF